MAVQFPGMVPMSFAQSPSMATQLQGLGKSLQGLAPKPAVPGAAPVGPAPMDISPAATNAGTNIPQPSIMAALKGMSPQGILDQLRTMSAGGQQVIPPGMPGSVALDSAGMLSPPVSTSSTPTPSSPYVAPEYGTEVRSAPGGIAYRQNLKTGAWEPAEYAGGSSIAPSNAAPLGSGQ